MKELTKLFTVAVGITILSTFLLQKAYTQTPTKTLKEFVLGGQIK